MADMQSLEVSPPGAFLTLQQIFDKALTGLREQGGPATDECGSYVCRYRGANGTACGVGQLIPDNAYDLAFDRALNAGVSNLIAGSPRFRAALHLGGVDCTDEGVASLLAELQDAHDRAFSIDSIEMRFVDMAKAYGLVYVAPGVQP